MKTLFETSETDFILDQGTIYDRQPDNWKEPEWVDEKAGTVKYKKYVKSVFIYVPDFNNPNISIKAKLNPNDILRLAEKIKEINTSSFIGIFEPVD